jgi:hypothetical protein
LAAQRLWFIMHRAAKAPYRRRPVSSTLGVTHAKRQSPKSHQSSLHVRLRQNNIHRTRPLMTLHRATVFAAILCVSSSALAADSCPGGEKRLRANEECFSATIVNYIYCVQNTGGGVLEFRRKSDTDKSKGYELSINGKASGIVVMGAAGGKYTSRDADRVVQEIADRLDPGLAATCDRLARTSGSSQSSPTPEATSPPSQRQSPSQGKSAGTDTAAAQTPAVDLTNSELTLSDFLDVNGKKDATVNFVLTRDCQLEMTLPDGIGFTVAYGLLSDRGTRIATSLMGIQAKTKRVELVAGTYRFILRAKRDAGKHTARLVSRCS